MALLSRVGIVGLPQDILERDTGLDQLA